MKNTISEDLEKHEIYTDEASGKGVIILANKTVRHGTVKVRKNRYKYFQYREGRKIRQIYLGVL